MIKEILAKSILRKQGHVDSWFLSSCGMNLYRGCTHNCSYCDGRAEKYNVQGEFGKDVQVKINAIEILNKELNPERKRTPIPKGYVLLGGGVCDTYQPVEEKYQLSGSALKLILKYNYPLHILTKSSLVLKDIEIIQEISKNIKALVSFSFSCCNDAIAKIVEPGVPLPSERLRTIQDIRKLGIPCGMFLMPVIPFITDTEEMIEESIRKARDSGIEYIIFGGMTLKEGQQKEHFFNVLEHFNPSLKQKYNDIYKGSPWGNAANEYYSTLDKKFYALAKKYNIPVRIPYHLYPPELAENDKVIIMLEHLHYVLRLKGESSYFALAAKSVSQLKEPISNIKDRLTSLNGIGPFTANVINEIIETGNNRFFTEKMKL